MDSHRPGVTSFVHVGLVVEDLDRTVRFLALLGFDCGEPGVFGGEWIDRIIGLEDVTVEVVMARAPDGTDMFEVVRFRSPTAGAQEPAPAANRPGLRHVAFRVDDVRGVVDRVREAGWETVGEIVDFESTFLLCYVRGPEGLIVDSPSGSTARRADRPAAARPSPLRSLVRATRLPRGCPRARGPAASPAREARRRPSTGRP